MSSRHKKSKNRLRPEDPSGIPNIYPPVPGYHMPTQWFPPQASAANYPYHWYQPWANVSQLSDSSAAWLPPATSVANTSTSDSPSKAKIAPGGPDEYTVDSMRRIYNNDEGSIEIERVKVLRRQGIYGTKQNPAEYPSESRSLVPVSPNVLNERRPPPRKHKKRGEQIRTGPDKHDGALPQGWYPYMSYLPQPFPYPYAFGYVWPMPPPPAMSPGYQSPNDESDCSVSRQETFPASVESPDLTLDKSRSPELQRPSSSAAASHITESLGNDIAPSDSVSMRGFKRETSLERLLRKSLSSSAKPSDRPSSDDMEKTKEWMEDMQKALESKSGLASEIAGDRSSFATAPSDIPTPPTKHKTKKEISTNSNMSRQKSNSESNIDTQEEQRNLVSLPFLESTRVSDSDLIYAFKKLEHASNVFKAHATSDVTQGENLEGDVERRKTSHEGNEQCSHASTLSFHSTKQSADENQIDTDSTDIAIPIDSSTADESVDNFDDSKTVEENYKWVLMHRRDRFENLHRNEDKPDDLIGNWRTEVSLWRARLVVSLCRGEGLDQQDWATFQLLAHHPLPMNLKLSLLHAHRLCSQNYDVGVAMLRNALLHLTTFGETLMKPEDERPSGWKTIEVDPNQPWVPIKGSIEILRVFGYHIREDGMLKYRRKISPEVSVIARLTLDLLVLAEEFRLFLNGIHQYPMNITQLFTPREAHGDKHSAVLRQSEKLSNIHQSSSVAKMEDGRDERDPASEAVRSDAEGIFKKQESTSGNQKEEQKFQEEENHEIQSNITDAVLHLTETFEKNDPLARPVEQFSPQPSDTLSSSSLPDLQSPTQGSLSKLDETVKDSGSRETLTSISPVEISQDKPLVKSITDDAKSVEREEQSNTDNPSEKPIFRCNPEDHIYEEIGETKAHAESLKTKESLSQSPPPLPPKGKDSAQNQDIYPHMEWSVSSQCSSVQGGSNPRKKKRKAPKPPEVFASEEEDEKEADITLPKGEADTNKSTKSPTENSEKVSRKPYDGNPFLEDIKPAGYIGKNPFYEDLDTEPTKKQSTEISSNEMRGNEEKPAPEKENELPNVTPSRVSTEDISEISEISISNLPAGVRPQRKKGKKSAALKKNQNISVTFAQNEMNSNLTNDEKSTETDSAASMITLRKIESQRSQGNKMPKISQTHDAKRYGKKTITKNEDGGHQWHPQVAVSNKTDKTGKGDVAKSTGDDKRDIIIQKIFITYDISLDDSKLSSHKIPKESTAEANQASKTQLSHAQINKADLSSTKIKNETRIEVHVPKIPTDSRSKDDTNKILSDSKTTCDTNKDVEKSVTADDANELPDNTKVSNKDSVSSSKAFESVVLSFGSGKEASNTSETEEEITKYALSSMKTDDVTKATSKRESATIDKDSSAPEVLQESKAPNIVPKCPPKSMLQTSGNSGASATPPPIPPPKAPLRLLDDIPYIDTNDVKSYKANYSSFGRNQPPHYGLTEIQPRSVTSSVSCGDDKASTFLKRSSFVPFIDETDLPPDSPPPSPPVPPPPTPPLYSPPPSPILQPSSDISDIRLPLPPPLPPPLTPPAIAEPPSSPSLPTPAIAAPPPPPDSPPSAIAVLPPPSDSSPSAIAVLPPPSDSSPSAIAVLPPPPDSPPPSLPKELIIISLSSPQEKDQITAASSLTPYPEKVESERNKTSLQKNENVPKKITSPDQEYSIAEPNIETDKLGEQIKTPEMTGTSVIHHPELPAMESDDHSNRKSTVFFGSEDKHRTPEPYSLQSEADGYEIPEPLKIKAEVEERYEIPDVTRASASASAFFHPQTAPSTELASSIREQGTSKKSTENSLPRRPPRHQLSFKIPPPRPPKPTDLDLPPQLPPKTGSLKYPSAPSVSQRTTGSLPSTLIKVSTKVQKSDQKNFSPTSHTLTSSPTEAQGAASRVKFFPPKASGLSSILSGSDTNKGKGASEHAASTGSKTLPGTSYPSTKSVSMPCSPKVSKYPRKLSKEEKKRQKSWPYLFCDCVYPTNNNDDIKYAFK